METSIKMLKIAADNHICAMILTPHNKPMRRNVSIEHIAEYTKVLQEKLQQEEIEIKLYYGSELYYRSGLTKELEEKRVSTLAGSHYVLIEFNPADDYDYIRNGIYSLLMGGYSPVLAHIERYRNVCMKKQGVEELIKMGCYIQVNAGSIMGQYGFSTKQFAKSLLKKRQVHFVATDAHDLEKRAPYIEECAHYVEKKYGADYRKEIFYDNPYRVIQDSYITC